MPSIEELAKEHNYPYIPLQTKIGKTQIDILPVEHCIDFGIQHDYFLSKVVDASDNIAIECCSLIYDSEYDEHTGALFYRGITNQCIERNISVFDVDSGRKFAEDCDYSTRFTLGVIAACGMAVNVATTVALEKIGCSSAVCLYGGNILSVATVSLLGLKQLDLLERTINRVYSSSNLIRYDHTIDFRDIRTALGLHELATSDDAPEQITVVYGANHAKGITYYIDNPRMLAKRFAYPINNARVDFNFREFEGKDGKLTLKRQG